MEYNLKRVLEFSIDDEEIDVFLQVLDTIKNKSSKLGYGKMFTVKEQKFVDALHESLIGEEDEENTDQGNK